MNEIIKLNNITYSYNNKCNVLNNINLTINEGDDIAIIGHNGSGKSTLAKIILGLIIPKTGTLEFNKTIINEKNVSLIREKCGIVFQNPDNQFIGITVEDDIAFGLENRNIEHDKMQGIINEYASKVGVLDLLKKSPENLSGGQKQRVAIAGILAMSPSLIIFDEALAMLDPKGKEEISRLIEDIKKENPKLTLIKITHDLDEAFNSKKVIVLNKGRIEITGTPNEVFKNEDKLKELGLDIPFIVKLNKSLLKDNLIKNEKYTFDEVIKEMKACK